MIETEESYVSRVSEYFLKKMGNGFFIPPKDIITISGWQEEGIPLAVVLKGVEKTLAEAEKNKAKATYSMKEFIAEIETPKIIWMMLPAGEITNQSIEIISNNLSANDILIDGGNSFYKDSMKHFEILKEKNIQFLDIGTSGGIWGVKNGYCLMIGGDKKAFKQILTY